MLMSLFWTYLRFKDTAVLVLYIIYTVYIYTRIQYIYIYTRYKIKIPHTRYNTTVPGTTDINTTVQYIILGIPGIPGYTSTDIN